MNEETKKWSRLHEHCVKCGRTDRRHEGKGLCIICYPHYRDPEKARVKKKLYRFRMRDEVLARQVQKTAEWRTRNRDRIKLYNAEYRLRKAGAR